MAQAVEGRARKCARRPKECAAKNAKDKCKCGQSRTLLRSDRRLGVRVTAEELNMNWETVRQIVKEDLGMRKFSAKMVPRILTHDQKKRRLHISSDLLRSAEMFDRVTTGHETWCFQYDPETNRQNIQWKTQNSSRPKNTHVSVAGQDHVCVFLRSQGDSSLWIHCTRTNGKSTLLFGNADKVTGICSKEKTRNLTWEVDSPPRQCPFAWCAKSSRVPG
jgi:histone-lysine N-methyltransferase SETMAR